MDLKALASKPVFFEKNRVFRVYLGGKLFSSFFGDDSKDTFYPEEWICSLTKALNEGSTDEFEGLSTVRGTDVKFCDLVNKEKELMLGGRKSFDVLVKALDSAIRLPVQAHPDKAFSRKYFNSDFGKAESWLVLDKREGAAVYFGFKDGVTRADFEKAVNDSETDKGAMERLLNKIPVEVGDVFFVPAKAIHAIGAGCLMLEVQEPTDFTIQPERFCGDYRLSDNEMYIGLEKSDALDVFDYSFSLDDVKKKCVKTPKTLYENGGCKKDALITKDDTPCFSLLRYTVKNGETEPLSSPCIYVVTDGSGELSCGSETIHIKKGDYFFMPFSCDKKYTAKSSSNLTVAACFPPEK